MNRTVLKFREVQSDRYTWVVAATKNFSKFPRKQSHWNRCYDTVDNFEPTTLIQRNFVKSFNVANFWNTPK